MYDYFQVLFEKSFFAYLLFDRSNRKHVISSATKTHSTKNTRHLINYTINRVLLRQKQRQK